jgi:hypothetical protein
MDYVAWILPGTVLISFGWLVMMAWKRRHMLFHRSKFIGENVMHNFQAQQQRAAMTYVMEEREMKIEEDTGDKLKKRLGK